MLGSSRRRLGTLAAVAATLLVPASLAWACVGVVALTTPRATVQPGGTLEVRGREFARGVPVQLRLDSPTGRLLATVPGPESTMNSDWTFSVPVPSDIPNGRHLLVATQDHHDMNSGAPARAVFYVGVPVPDEPEPEVRPAGLTVDEGPGVVSLVLVGLGVAAAGLLAAAGYSARAARSTRGSAGGQAT